jgi:hypothetical protein
MEAIKRVNVKNISHFYFEKRDDGKWYLINVPSIAFEITDKKRIEALEEAEDGETIPQYKI